MKFVHIDYQNVWTWIWKICEISDQLNQPLNCVWTFVWTCMWKVCEISTNKSSIKVCENVCEKRCEKDDMVSHSISSIFHMPFTQYNFTHVKKMWKGVKIIKTVWNKPAFHSLFHIVFTCLLLVVFTEPIRHCKQTPCYRKQIR